MGGTLTEVGGTIIVKRMRECVRNTYVRLHNLLSPCFSFSSIMPTGMCLHAQAKALMFYMSQVFRCWPSSVGISQGQEFF